MLFDPGRRSHFTKDFMRSKSSNTPFLNEHLDGMVEVVVHDGKILLDRAE